MAGKLNFNNLWQRLKMDFKERFLNFETAKGVYLIPAGLITCAVSIYYQQYVIQVLGVLFGWYMFSEGLRKTFVNRIKQEKAQDTLRATRDAVDKVDEPQVATKPTITVAAVGSAYLPQ